MIPIRNIYYMLSYAFSVLNKQGYRELATESFKNAAELCAAILHIGISHQIKRGLGRNYITELGRILSSRQNRFVPVHKNPIYTKKSDGLSI